MVIVTYPPQTIAIIKRKHKKLYKKVTIPQKSFEGNKSKNTIQKCWKPLHFKMINFPLTL